MSIVVIVAYIAILVSALVYGIRARIVSRKEKKEYWSHLPESEREAIRKSYNDEIVKNAVKNKAKYQGKK